MKIICAKLLLITIAIGGLFASSKNVSAVVPSPTAYWKLDEASGNRQDSISTNHLTVNGSVSSTAGKIGQSSKFTASTTGSWLSINDNSNLSTGDIDFTIAAWVWADDLKTKVDPALPVLRVIAAKRDSSASGKSEWMLLYDAAANSGKGGFRFYTYNSSGQTIGDVTSPVIPAVGKWYHVVAWRNKSNDSVGINVNNGTATVAHENLASGTTSDTTVPFRIGRTTYGPLGWWGRIDEVGFWKRTLTAAEISELWNNGNGKTFSGSGSKIGDINQDGVVNGTDHNLLIQNFGRTGSNTSDLNKDSVVDVFDYNLLLWDYNYGYSK